MHGHCKQPKLSAKQEAHLVALHDAGEHTIGGVGGLFTLTRSTIYLAIGPQPRPRCPDRSIEPASTLAAASSSATNAPSDRVLGWRPWRDFRDAPRGPGPHGRDRRGDPKRTLKSAKWSSGGRGDHRFRSPSFLTVWEPKRRGIGVASNRNSPAAWSLRQARVPPAVRSAPRGERPEPLVWLQGLFCASRGVVQRREERAPI
jgi:hypothetical protein